MFPKSKPFSLLLFLLLTWNFSLLILLITWYNDTTPTCANILYSNNIEETAKFKKIPSELNGAVSFLTQHVPNSAKIRSSKRNVSAPTLQIEISQRRIFEDVTELWYYLKVNLKYLQRERNVQKLQQKVQEIIEFTTEQKNLILHDTDDVTQSDELKKWRYKEHNYLSNLIQTRLHKLQNPSDCEKVKKIRCDLTVNCGFGCKIHHLVFCLITAYATQRTLIFDDESWGFTETSWNMIFQPISNCSLDNTVKYSNWKDGMDNSDSNFFLPLIGEMIQRPSFLPLSIPQELAPRLIRLHGDPIVWWIGQFLKYLLRPQSTLQSAIKIMEERINFEKPIVGVHIRRTDKIGTEADFHGVKKYMAHVDEYFDFTEMKTGKLKRKVYLASDDLSVFSQAKKSYPQYNFLSDADISESALPENRQSKNSLLGIILDIYFLSKCDFIVCTFSSNVCRAAYELMQTRNPDASTNFRSLDDIYYFSGQHDHDYEVILPHKAKNESEIDLEVGDRVHIAGNHWNGYSKGRVRRTNRLGLFPTYKTRNIIRVVDFPTFSAHSQKFDRK